jgi:hypothetical protein
LLEGGITRELKPIVEINLRGSGVVNKVANVCLPKKFRVRKIRRARPDLLSFATDKLNNEFVVRDFCAGSRIQYGGPLIMN